ncbi:MAG TPA: metallophosphoesterase [Bacteroidales bacterium]|nr:metallophosphoesterase [Bacteroidales bacterium]
MGRQWVIPDIHGYVKTVSSLVGDLIRPARYDEIYFLGDYIDRGPGSKEVIDFIRTMEKDEYNVTTLKGNHEDVLVELYDAQVQPRQGWWGSFRDRKLKAWLDMGGRTTLDSFGVKQVKEIPADYIEWMRNRPHYALLDRFVLVHAGLNFRNDDPFEDQQSMLWLREYEIRPERIGGRRIIHGHVPVNMELITQSIHSSFYKFIDLDNGPYLSGKDGFGNLVALELNSMEMVIQYNMDLG